MRISVQKLGENEWAKGSRTADRALILTVGRALVVIRMRNGEDVVMLRERRAHSPGPPGQGVAVPRVECTLGSDKKRGKPAGFCEINP